MNPAGETTDRVIDRLRHAWPVYTIFGVLLASWVLAVLATGLSTAGGETFWVVLGLPLVPLGVVFRFWFWSHVFSRRRKDD